MSYREQVAQEVKEVSDNSSSGQDSGQSESLEQIEVDFNDTAWVKFTPTTMVTGTFPEDEGNPAILLKDHDRLNELGDDAFDDQGNDLRYVSTRYLGLVMDDVGIDTDEFEDAVVLETVDDTTDYRVFDLADDDTSEIEGTGIKFGDRLYEGEVVDDPENFVDRAIVVVDRTASVSVAKKLDANGATSADMDESAGEPNDGLIEYAPDDEPTPENRRYASPFVQVRDDLLGEEIGVMVSRRAEMDEDYAERVEDDDDPARDMYWYSVFTTEDGETVEPVAGDRTGYSYLQWNFDPTAGHLPDDQWEFVQQYISQDLPDDEETIQENIEENADQFDDDPNVERMTRLIQNEVTAQ